MVNTINHNNKSFINYKNNKSYFSLIKTNLNKNKFNILFSVIKISRLMQKIKVIIIFNFTI